MDAQETLRQLNGAIKSCARLDYDSDVYQALKHDITRLVADPIIKEIAHEHPEYSERLLVGLLTTHNEPDTDIQSDFSIMELAEPYYSYFDEWAMAERKAEGSGLANDIDAIWDIMRDPDKGFKEDLLAAAQCSVMEAEELMK